MRRTENANHSIGELITACGPALADLLTAQEDLAQMPLFAGVDVVEPAPAPVQSLVDEKLLSGLPSRLRKAADDAAELFRFLEKKQQMSFTPAFNPLLGVIDEAARGLVCKKLQPLIPQGAVKERDWFEPHYAKLDGSQRRHYEELARNLRKTLVLHSGVSPLGLLRNCLDHALNDRYKPGGVFDSIRVAFKFTGSRKLLESVQALNDFRNTRVAHQEQPVSDAKQARSQLIRWIAGLAELWNAGQD